MSQTGEEGWLLVPEAGRLRHDSVPETDPAASLEGDWC